MKKFFTKIFLLILLPLIALDIYYRTRPETFRWYSQLQPTLRSDELNIFLVGSSRVATAIDADRASAFLRSHGIPHAHVYNLGAPYSTIAQHFLGLRNLATEKPEALRGSIWLLESHYGLPGEKATWEDSWLNPEYKDQLLNVLRAQDLPKFWSSRGLSFFDKAYISTTYFSKLGRSFLDTRMRLIVVGERAVDRWISKSSDDAKKSELSSEGGVRTDSAGIQYARHLALQEALRARSELVSHENWDQQIIRDWVTMVRQVGGQPYFFHMPLSSVQAETYQAQLKLGRAEVFAETAGKWGATIVPVQFNSTDEDFPDLIHLRKTRRDEYTDALFDEILSELTQGEVQR